MKPPYAGITRAALRIAGIYLAISVIWIIGSDRLVAAFGFPESTAVWVQTFKGWAFVTVTAAIIFYIVYREMRRMLEFSSRLRLLTDNLSDVVFQYRVSPTPEYLYVSPSVVSLLGYAPQDYYNDPYFAYRVVHPDDHSLLERVTAAMDDDVATPVVIRWLRKDGTVVWAEQKARTYVNEHGETVMEGVARDVTGQIGLRHALNERNEELYELNQTLEEKVEELAEKAHRQEKVLFEQARLTSLSELLRSIAHHWRQPLNVIGLVIQGLADAVELGELSDDDVKHAESVVMTTVQRMSETIDRFREFYTAPAGVGIFDALAVAVDTAAMYAPVCRERGIDVVVIGEDLRTGIRHEVDIDPEVPSETVRARLNLALPIRSDSSMVKQVLVELVANAREAIIKDGDGGRIEIAVTRDRKTLTITVADTGVGVDSVISTRIFDPYITGDAKGNQAGLGLYLTRQIVADGLGGTIAHERTGDTTRFTVVLPDMAESSVETEVDAR